jgi:hypothetical protein
MHRKRERERERERGRDTSEFYCKDIRDVTNYIYGKLRET